MRRRLNPRDLLADFAGGLGGLLGQRLDFGGHNRKAAPGVAGACRLDSGIEGQKIGLPCNHVDQFDDVADTTRSVRQLADTFGGGTRLLHGFACHARRLLHLAADLVD